MEYIDTYQQLLRHKPESVRTKARKSVLDILSGTYSLLHDTATLFRLPRIQFLYIHHIFKDEEENLDRLLQALSRHHRFISYSDAVRRILTGDIDGPYICISSDDGLRNNLSAAAVLNKYGISACFFICPSIVGENDPEKISEFARLRLHFPPVEFMTWAEVEALQSQGHEIGGHTMSHINVAATEPERLEAEIAGCHEVILQKCGSSDHFAYPYGRYGDFTEYGRELTFRSGYKSCASAARGCHIVRQGEKLEAKDLLIRRDHLILSWPTAHILYFIARNASVASVKNNYFSGLCAS
jgi:peptidoglycan/xylan/chitin deacetylase (PgdA/CDA1 family)